MQTEMDSLKQARERAEANVAELKDKLREEITQHQLTKAQSQKESGEQSSRARERY